MGIELPFRLFYLEPKVEMQQANTNKAQQQSFNIVFLS